MKKIITLIAAMCLALGLVACQTKQDTGALTGAVVGGIIGSQIGGGSGQVIATVGGVVLGAVIGGSIGRSMDDVDSMKMNRAMEHSSTNHTTTWRNPDSGNVYAVTPTNTYQNSSNQPCREYTTIATVGGKKQEIVGTACRQQDGTWRTIK